MRRINIPKDRPGETRPLGLPTFADKMPQRAVVMLLEPIYAQDSLDCPYGFRRERSAHQAPAAIREPLMERGGGRVIEVDIRKFFDNLDHEHLRTILRQRVRDGVVLRLIGKWLHAGILEDEILSYPEAGIPQGGVISPLLANIYLHEVLDKWFAEQIQPRLRGRSWLVRYADDLVLCFACEADARRVYDVLPKRFGRYALQLHPEKTRLLEFQRPPGGPGTGCPPPVEQGRRETFDFLGFTHDWARSRRGSWVIKRKTASSRFSRAVRRLNQWLRRVRHERLIWQHQRLSQKLRGHYQYYGITGDSICLARFRALAERMWLKWLRRPDQRGQRRTWTWFWAILARHPLPRTDRLPLDLVSRSEPVT